MPPQQGTSIRTTVRAPDVVAAQNFGQLLGVIHHIQLWAADERHAAANEILMEVAVGIGRAVRRDEQVCPVKIRRVDRRKLDLNRPLAKLGGDDARRGVFRMRTAVHVELTDAAARTAARVLRLLFLFARFHVPGDGGFVIGRGLALLEGNRPGWAGGQAVAQPSQ